MENEEDRAAAVEKNLTVGCIFGLMDPLRKGIKDSILKCHNSGINVRMCTGDNINTAIAISLDAGLVTQEEIDNDD
jgi:Ca2+-transporting ATPase